MSIQREIESPTSSSERSDEIVIIADMKTGYSVNVLRVTRDFYSDGTYVETKRRWIKRGMSQLVLDADASALMPLLPAIFDRWAEEDDAAIAAELAAAAAAAETLET